jgi:Ca2+-transporting ATPase
VNKLSTPKIKSLWEIILENFEDPINQILVVAAIVSLFVGVLKDGRDGLIEPLSIVMALIIITVVNSANNYASEIKLRDLLMLSGGGSSVAVFRNGPNPRLLSTSKMVVGDVYELVSGVAVPADSIVIQSNKFEELICDESALTGEAEQIYKKLGSPLLS